MIIILLLLCLTPIIGYCLMKRHEHTLEHNIAGFIDKSFGLVICIFLLKCCGYRLANHTFSEFFHGVIAVLISTMHNMIHGLMYNNSYNKQQARKKTIFSAIALYVKQILRNNKSTKRNIIDSSKLSSASGIAAVEPFEILSPFVCVIRGCNPGPHTLQGTNTYLVGYNGIKASNSRNAFPHTDVNLDAPVSKGKVLIDTGEDGCSSEEYVPLLLDVVFPLTGTTHIEAVLLTHHHPDHIGGIIALFDGLKEREMLPLPALYKQYGPYRTSPSPSPIATNSNSNSNTTDHSPNPTSRDCCCCHTAGCKCDIPHYPHASYLKSEEGHMEGGEHSLVSIVLGVHELHSLDMFIVSEDGYKFHKHGEGNSSHHGCLGVTVPVFCPPTTTPSVHIQAVKTPGHTEDHMSFVIREDRALLSGDSILGCGTTTFDCLHTYMQTLHALQHVVLYGVDVGGKGNNKNNYSMDNGDGLVGEDDGIGLLCGGCHRVPTPDESASPRTPALLHIYPGHGPVLVDSALTTVDTYIQHRILREQQIVQKLRKFTTSNSVSKVEETYDKGRYMSSWQLMREVYCSHGESSASATTKTLGLVLQLSAQKNVQKHLLKLEKDGVVENSSRRCIASGHVVSSPITTKATLVDIDLWRILD